MNEDRITVREALRDGDLYTRLSAVIMGAGMLGHRQIVKGILVLLMEVAFWLYMVTTGFHNLAMLPSLGTEAQGKVWNEAKQIYEYTAGDNSQQILLAGVVTCFVIVGFVALWILQMRHSYKLQKLIEVVREAEPILGDCSVSVNVPGGSVKVPYALLLTRLTTMLTLHVGGKSIDFHLWSQPSSPDTFR